ncbi:MAG TPA: zeta toxin family protein [Patescibacteria group bacterium]|nr:zeta toxin family protein [Patescibacteria group bacterium]
MLRRDVSDEEFEALSKTKKKVYIAELIIRDSGAIPVDKEDSPIAVIMAGLPGAGKTEFLDTLTDLVQASGGSNPFVRIDLDQIVTVYPGYTPQTYARFRSNANDALARCIDKGRNGRYNLMIDGTFAGQSGSSVKNVEKLLESGYIVYLYFMHDKAQTAWSFTKSRELETNRGIDSAGFVEASKNIPKNVKAAKDRFQGHPMFHLYLVLQKELRDKDYKIISDLNDIDSILDEGYNIDKLKEI